MVITLILYFIVAIFAVKDFTSERPHRLNEYSATCGMDSNALDKPYELYLDARKCYYLTKDGPQDPIEDFNKDYCNVKRVSSSE